MSRAVGIPVVHGGEDVNGSITDVRGIRVGHWTDARGKTGCTVVLCETGAIGGYAVRGGSPGTRETDLLDPLAANQAVHAFLLTGGSAYGLGAADGVMRYLEERRIGIAIGTSVVPIVPTAVIFDLGVGDAKARPDAESGYAACVAASRKPPAEGRVGAGTGATVGKLFGRERARPGGVGTAARRVAGVTVGALFVVNCVGEVVDERGRVIAGALGLRSIQRALLDGRAPTLRRPGLESTTIGVVATDAALTKVEANRLASIAHDGMALAVRPAHTRYDGDTVFAASTRGRRRVDLEVLAAAAVEVTTEAIRHAVRRGTRDA